MAVINIGSGSVKLYLESSKKTTAVVTLLGQGTEKAIIDTYEAVASFCFAAKSAGEAVLIFGTEAMRTSGDKLKTLIFKGLGYDVDIISGEKEALCGFVGAGHMDTCLKTVIDVGGASTEISCGKNNIPSLLKSIKTGSVALYNIFAAVCLYKEDADSFINKLFDYIDLLLDLSPLPKSDSVFLIGGTALALAGIDKNLKTYKDSKVDGHIIYTEKLRGIIEKLFCADVKERVNAYPFLEEKRALVLPYGISIICRTLSKIKAAHAQVSAQGLIEGYILLKSQKTDI